MSPKATRSEVDFGGDFFVGEGVVFAGGVGEGFVDTGGEVFLADGGDHAGSLEQAVNRRVHAGDVERAVAKHLFTPDMLDRLDAGDVDRRTHAPDR